MAVINKAETGIALGIKKKLGRSSEYGQKLYGWHEYGEYDVRFGIYTIRTRGNKQTQTRMRFYIPTNPQTETQQAHRATFAAAILAWQNLTTGQKAVYNERTKYKPLSGYNLYIREYLQSH